MEMNQTRSSFLRSIIKEIRTALQLEGFRYIGRAWYEKQISEDTTGIVTHASSIYPNDPTVYINASVGIRYEPLARLLAELCRKDNGKFPPATLSCALGYLTAAKKYVMYPFSPSNNTEKDSRDLVQAIRHEGMNWMQAHQSLDAILHSALDFRYCPKDRARFRLPSIYYLKGDYESARLQIDRGLQEVADNQDQHSDEYRRFAANLLKRIHTEKDAHHSASGPNEKGAD